jgi:hypothetical protein
MAIRLVIWECPRCGFHHRISTDPKPVEHCSDCETDVKPVVVHQS